MSPMKHSEENRGLMKALRAYNELDDIPASVHPGLYQALENWGFDGFVMADDTGNRVHRRKINRITSDSFTGIAQLDLIQHVADSTADAMAQWFNAGGMLQFYDYPLETYLNVGDNYPE